jgi:Tol biopolymer transport system component
MGEVYRARDTKLDRDVALKTLPASFAADPDRLARFEREAKVLASLNHANIAHVYDAGQHDLAGPGGTSARIAFLTMELVDGEDLSARIARGPIPLQEALPIAREIAAALDAAHAQGIVHRDLKPANIKLKGSWAPTPTRLPDGRLEPTLSASDFAGCTVKVLDFGLAKALAPDGASATAGDAANSPTLTAQAGTQMGMIIGTAAYMAPEQARGRAVDKRADIWAFGCVLFEMLTGRRLFAGEDLTEILASVVKEQPDLSAAPVEVQRLLRRCLEKDPKKRLRDIGDVWDLLDTPVAAAIPATPRATSALAIAWSVAAIGLVFAGVLGFVLLRGTSAPRLATEFQLAWPAGASESVGGGRFFALSPDGRHVAIVDQNMMWVRSLDAVDPIKLDRTEGATYPFWSPDSASLAFFAGGQLKRIARTGGPVQVVTAAPDGRGGTWSRNGTIVFSDVSGRQGLQRVPAAGGTATPVTKLTTSGTSDGHRYPQFLPDGEHFLYLHLTGTADVGGVYLGALDGAAPIKVLDGQENAWYSPSTTSGGGYLLVRRQDTLMAQPFDPVSRKNTGALFPVIEGAGQGANTGVGAVSVSATGDLIVWAGGSRTTELTWMDRSGKHGSLASPPLEADAFALSADGRRVALGVSAGGFTGDVWTLAVPDGTPSKFTFGPPPGWTYPVWSPNASEIAYATLDNAGLAGYELHRKKSDMSGREESLVKSDAIIRLWDWAPDGTYLVYNSNNALWQLPVDAQRSPRKPVQLTTAATDEEYGQVSPDGRWLAYAAGDRGNMQIYVQPMPATGAMWLVSKDGGTQPRWRRDGKELYYRGADGRLMAVPIVAASGTSFQNGTPQALFGSIPTFGNTTRFTYQPSADGQRFLVAVPVESAAKPMTVVLNWEQMIRR